MFVYSSSQLLTTLKSFSDPPYIIHPAVLDAALHGILHPFFTGTLEGNAYYLPSSIEHVMLHNHDQHLSNNLYSHVTIQKWTPGRCTVALPKPSHYGPTDYLSRVYGIQCCASR